MAKVTRIGRTPKEARAEALPLGLHAGIVEKRTKRAFRVRLSSSGEVVRATLGDGVNAALVEECLKERRLVVVTRTLEGVAIVGALQTQPNRAAENAALAGESVDISAERAISLRVGKAMIVLEQDGAIRITGDLATMRLAKALRVLAAKVELP